MKHNVFLPIDEGALHWIKYLSKQMLRFHSQFLLIYDVSLLYSTCLMLEMISTNKVFNLSLGFSFYLNQRIKTLPLDYMTHPAIFQSEENSHVICVTGSILREKKRSHLLTSR